MAAPHGHMDIGNPSFQTPFGARQVHTEDHIISYRSMNYNNSLPYVPKRLHMAPETEGVLSVPHVMAICPISTTSISLDMTF
jgi:hypothetical protein